MYSLSLQCPSVTRSPVYTLGVQSWTGQNVRLIYNIISYTAPFLFAPLLYCIFFNKGLCFTASTATKIKARVCLPFVRGWTGCMYDSLLQLMIIREAGITHIKRAKKQFLTLQCHRSETSVSMPTPSSPSLVVHEPTLRLLRALRVAQANRAAPPSVVLKGQECWPKRKLSSLSEELI